MCLVQYVDAVLEFFLWANQLELLYCQGVAAAPFNGPTLLSLLGMCFNSKSDNRLRSLSESEIADLRKKFKSECGVGIKDVGVIMVDEVSFVNDTIIGQLDAKLRWLYSLGLVAV